MNYISGEGWPVPAGAKAIPYNVWHARMVHEALERAREVPVPPPNAPMLAAATARDRYGWRGLRGTSWIGPQEG